MKKLLFAGLMASALFTTSAFAHAKLEMAMPAAGSTGPSPKSIMLHFNEKLEPKLSGFDITGPDGAKVDVKAQIDKTAIMMNGVVSGRLKPGTYKVNWHAVTSDGHRVTGDYSFTVK